MAIPRVLCALLLFAEGGSYAIDGGRDKRSVTQSGVWAVDATSPGAYTTFHADGFVAFTPEMVGWVRAANEPERSTASLRRQPDINRETPEQTRCVCSGTFATRTAPITDIDPQQCTITVAGDYVGSGAPLLGGINTRYRLPRGSPLDCPCGSWPSATAPPGTETRGSASGMLSKWVAAESSRCLYNGYRYESPLAGMQDWTTTTPSAVGRQGGLNFAGQHYTLFRHYDPTLMRFTSPDPAASPWWNLHGYAGNSPAALFDPDGLYGWSKDRSSDPWWWSWLDAGYRIADGMRQFASLPYQYSDHYANGAPEPELTQMYRQMDRAYEDRQQLLEAAGDGKVVSHGCAVFLAIGDVTGATGVAEYATKTDSVTGNRLSDHEARVRGITGGFGLVMTAMGGARVISGVRGVAGKLRPASWARLTRFKEYMRYRSQGYSPTVASNLTKSYSGMGQHVIQRHVFRDIKPSTRMNRQLLKFRDSSLNVFSGRGMSKGRFYEMHWRLHGKPAFGDAFNAGWHVKGGHWSPHSMNPMPRPFGKAGYIWYGRPDALRLSTYRPIPNAYGSAAWAFQGGNIDSFGEE